MYDIEIRKDWDNFMLDLQVVEKKDESNDIIYYALNTRGPVNTRGTCWHREEEKEKRREKREYVERGGRGEERKKGEGANNQIDFLQARQVKYDSSKQTQYLIIHQISFILLLFISDTYCINLLSIHVFHPIPSN